MLAPGQRTGRTRSSLGSGSRHSQAITEEDEGEGAEAEAEESDSDSDSDVEEARRARAAAAEGDGDASSSAQPAPPDDCDDIPYDDPDAEQAALERQVDQLIELSEGKDERIAMLERQLADAQGKLRQERERAVLLEKVRLRRRCGEHS